MKNASKILIGVVCVCILLWIYRQKMAATWALESLDNSIGTFDSYAQDALKRVESVKFPTKTDNFVAARIVDLNANEGYIANRNTLNDVVERYETSLAKGDADTKLDWYEIDQIENFAQRHGNLLQGNQRYQSFVETLQEQRPKLIKATLKDAKKNGETKKEQVDLYLEENVVFHSDSQNVHDSSVNEHLRKTWLKLSENKKPPTSEKLEEIKKEILDTVDKKAKSKQKCTKALKEMMKPGRYNMSIGAHESDLVATIWERSSKAKTPQDSELLKESFVSSLSDMVENGNVVCSNGRCSRLIESLVFLDDEVTGAMTTEQIRNDALKISNEKLQETIQEMIRNKDKMDAKLVQVALSYNDPDIQTDKDSEKRFKDIVKSKITFTLDRNFKDRMSEKDYEKTLIHCLTAIESI